PTGRGSRRPRAGTWRPCSRTRRCRSGCRPRSRNPGRSPPKKLAEATERKSMSWYLRGWSALAVWLCALTLPGGRPAEAAAAGAPFPPEDLQVVEGMRDRQVWADGRYIVFVQRDTDLAANRGRTTLWLMALAAGARPQQLTDPSGGDSSPRWAPDSRTLYFLSTRSGSQQVWRVVLTGAEARRITDFPLDVGSLRVSPLGKLLAVSMGVFPDCPTLTCTRHRLH